MSEATTEKCEVFGVVLTNPLTKIVVTSKNDAERIREVVKLWKSECPTLVGEKSLQTVATIVLNSKGEKIKDIITKTKDFFKRNYPEVPEEVKGNWFVNSYLGFPKGV